MPKRCFNCGSTALETDTSVGQVTCTSCFAIVEESILVSEVGFAEGSGGRVHVQGTYVSHHATGFQGGGSAMSAEKIKTQGHERIKTIADNMAIDDNIMIRARRFFNLAIDAKFNKGRRTEYLVASCLYLAGRYNRGDKMLIDFSERMSINVFELGSTYLKLRSALHLKDPMPEVDPAIYNIRFAHRLDFGKNLTRQVAADATRLVKRFKADWMTQGRRPAGIAGACLVVAARMSGFLRTPEEVAQVVKVAPTTIKKRLMEFARTHVATKTVAEWRNLTDEDLARGEEIEPPISKENKEKERARIEAVRIQRLRDQGAEIDEEEEEEEEEESAPAKKKPKRKGKRSAAQIAEEGRGGGEVQAENDVDGAIQAAAGEFGDEDMNDEDDEEDDNLAEMEQGDFIEGLNSARDNPDEVAREVAAAARAFKREARALNNEMPDEDELEDSDAMSEEEEKEEVEDKDENFDQWDDLEATYKWLGSRYFQDEIDIYKLTDEELFERVKSWLGGRDPQEIHNEFKCVERARKERERFWKEEKQSEFPELDDEELEGYYVMAEEDLLSRTRAWLSHNGQWLEEEQERAAKRALQSKNSNNDGGQPKKKRKRAAPHKGPFNSAREAIDTFANQKKFSARLNYGALNQLTAFATNDKEEMDPLAGLEAFGDEKDDEKYDEDDPANW